MPTDAAQREDPRPRHAQEDSGREDVDEGGRAAAVEVTHVIAEVGGDGEMVDYLGGWGLGGPGCGGKG